MKHKYLKSILLVVIFVFITSATFAQVFTVERVIDGDTIKLTTGEVVRLIGIDTPESKRNEKAKKDSKRTGQDLETITKLGEEATEFVKTLIQPGQEVRLEFDVERRDRYKRLLAYVYDAKTYKGCIDCLSPIGYAIVNGNEIFINATIVKSGYASPMTIPPNVKYADLFKVLYQEARENKIGLWDETK